MSTEEDMDEYGRDKIHYVAVDFPEHQHDALITELFNNGADINLQDNNGWTALHFAAQKQSLPAVKKLLELGANLELKDTYGNTPLFRAVFCSKGDGKIITLMLENGANPDSENEHGVSPRSLASTIANYDIEQFFK